MNLKRRAGKTRMFKMETTQMVVDMVSEWLDQSRED